MRSKKSQSQILIDQLLIRFKQLPRKCKKINDSGIGTSQRIVCISNDTFFYYPKIQEFVDLDFDKLKYVVPKAGVKLPEILQLRFPPRRNNQRNYFEITIPKNKILKYTKTSKQLIVDETAQGDQTWTFVFDYDIISLPELEQRSKQREKKQRQQMIKKKKMQQEYNKQREQQKKKKRKQEYESLEQAERAMDNKDQANNSQYNKNKQEKQKKQDFQKRMKALDQLYFTQCYDEGYQNFKSLEEELEFQISLLEVIGRFKLRAETIVRKHIDDLPFNPKPQLQQTFKIDNLIIKIGDSKQYNHQFLNNLQVSNILFNIRKSIRPHFRVPLMCFIKYKGLKVLVRACTQVDQLKGKIFDQHILHGECDQIWKTHFLLSDDLLLILDNMNLKPFTSQVHFQKATIHLGINFQLVETNEDPFSEFRNFNPQRFLRITQQKIVYAFNISEVYPIDLDLENNIKQVHVRLRPQFINSLKDDNGDPMKLTGGGLTYEYQDEQGYKNDYLIAKASQILKYKTIGKFVKDLDNLKYVPMSSGHFGAIIKQQGINMRYIGNIYKLTSLPYIRQMAIVEAISREVKKIYREHQKQYILEHFRRGKNKLIDQAYSEKLSKALKFSKLAELRDIQNEQSIANAIDFLNLIFGNSEECQTFWEIITKKVKDNYKVELDNYLDLSHGYLLTTILYHCGFQIKLSSSIVLFATPNPFNQKDWIKFVSKSKTLHFPSMQVYKKMNITTEMSPRQIINRLELALLIKRTLFMQQSAVLSKLSLHVSGVDIPGPKYSVENLEFFTQTPSKQNFETAFDICNFILPPNHPFFQDLYMQFASLSSFEPITLKRAAEIHAIRSLGLTHEKTSKILSGFKEQAYLKHLISSQSGLPNNRKLEIYRKIIEQQQSLGKLTDSFSYVKKAITFVKTRGSSLQAQQIVQYYRCLSSGMVVTYNLRKIEDMLKISQHFWDALENYTPQNSKCYKQLQHILKYSIKAYMQSSNKKYYLFKLVLVLNDSYQSEGNNLPKEPKEYYLDQLRLACRQASNHINLIKQMLTKLEFGYSQINYKPDFFSKFWKHIGELQSQQLNEGLDQYELFLRIFNLGFYEQALLNRSYTFDRGGNWQIPNTKIQQSQKI